DERRDERGLSDAELADHRAMHDLTAAARGAHGLVIRGLQIRFFGVAPHEIAAAAGARREALLAREAALEGVDAHLRRRVGVRVGVRERERRRVAPSKLATHDAIDAARDP